MSNLAKHARKLQASKRIPELEQLANSKNRHDTYLYLMHLQPIFLELPCHNFYSLPYDTNNKGVSYSCHLSKPPLNALHNQRK